MIIAREKKQQNIIEYILYMWQIEDLIRAYDFDMEKIEKNIISQFDIDQNTRQEMRQWYENLIMAMENDKVKQKGHITTLRSLIAELNDLHLRLLKSPFHQDYQKVFQRTLPYISAYYSKMKDHKKSIIEMSLEALYGILMLRLSKKQISAETQEAVNYISDFLSFLAKKYHQMQDDEDFYL